MQKRSLFKSIFGEKKQNPKQNLQMLRMLNDFTPTFYTCNMHETAIVKTCINTIATHASKFEIQHKKYKTDDVQVVNGDINYLLQHRPNPLMNTSQFIYKVIYNLYAQNNSFVYIHKDKTGMVTGFYPITAQSYDLLEDESGKIYLQFVFVNGNQYTLPYEEVIHLKKFYNKREIFGDNNDALKDSVATNQTAMQGISNAIRTTSSMRGLLKYTNGMLNQEQMKNYKDNFVSDFLSIDNTSGVAMLDTKMEFTPIKIDPITLTDNQLKLLNENIYNYFGINERIINATYTAEEWNSFFESVLEPLAIQMEQEFTTKIFNDKAIRAGHRIVFSVERIRYSNVETKITLIKELGVLGILTVDEARAILDMSLIGGDEGAKRLQTLNVVNSELADTYQVGGTND